MAKNETDPHTNRRGPRVVPDATSQHQPAPPASLESERYVLGAMLLDPAAATRVLATLQPAHFYADVHHRIFAVAVKLHALRGFIDLISITEELAAGGADTAITAATLGEMTARIGSVRHLAGHLEQVINTSRRREIIDAAERARMAAYDESADHQKAAAKVVEVAGESRATRRRPVGQNPTHDAIGDAYIERHPDTIHARGRWYRYSGGVWSVHDGAEAEVWALLKELRRVGVKPTRTVRSSVQDYIAHTRRIPDASLDEANDLICLANGVYDITASKLLPHSPEYFFTSALPFSYDERATAPRWLEALAQWFPAEEIGGEESQAAAIAHLQEAAGYSLTADTSHHIAWMLEGGGSNGKDTFLNALRALAGTGHHELDLSLLTRTQYGLAYVPGKRLVTCTEAPEHVVADAYIKRLISGETMEARRPYGEPFNFRPIAKIWWAVNEKPAVADTSWGYWRRWVLVPFKATFTVDGSKKVDRSLGSVLDSELPGIFNWAMAGLRRLRQRGRFDIPTTFQVATLQYRLEQDTTAQFKTICTGPLPEEFPATAGVPPRQLYDSYKSWCKQCGYHAKGVRRFSADMERLGAPVKKSNGFRVHVGIILKEESAWE